MQYPKRIPLAMQKTPHPTTLIKQFMDENNLMPMDLVRTCNISVKSAYEINKAQPLTDLNVIYKVYNGLRQSGYSVTWMQLTGIE
jgi:hypothetical protein